MQTNTHIFTISELNRSARTLLENHFSTIWVSGEISNFSQPASGHWYFTLKDNTAQVRCAMFRGHNQRIKFTPEHGMEVLIRAKVSLYEGRGEYQLIVEQMEEQGVGNLQRAFEQLKEKLLKEGLFAEEHKQALPAFPECIGVVTSPTGAAIRDILSVLQRRYPRAPVIIYPTMVQGETAAAQIAQAIATANIRKECDLLLLSRGGGSLEDLWSFNEEIVARAVFQSTIPIICGVGHETDFTMADFVADRRAPTPSAAAELASPNQPQLLQQVVATHQFLCQHVQRTLQNLAQHHDGLQKRLAQCHPTRTLQTQRQHIAALTQRLQHRMQTTLTQHQHRLQLLTKALDTISPLATLQRGYSILTNASGTVIQKSQDTHPGDTLTAQLSEGTLLCTVTE